MNGYIYTFRNWLELVFLVKWNLIIIFSSFWRKSLMTSWDGVLDLEGKKNWSWKKVSVTKEGPLDSVSLYRLALEVEKVSNGRNQLMRNSVCQWSIPAVPQITHMGSDEHYMVLGLTPVKGQFTSSPFSCSCKYRYANINHNRLHELS